MGRVGVVRPMTERTDRLLAVLIILVALLLITQATVVPRNRLFAALALPVAAVTIGYAVVQLGDTLR